VSRGCHGLIRDGATLVRDWTDIVNELPASWRACLRIDVKPAESRDPATGDEAVVLDILGDEPLPIERLIAATGLGPGRTSAALTGLEVKGWARQIPAQRFVRSG
jgi:DNA processing protein